jgi:glycosyltransferase involved in cell wall biosynthesis
MHDGRIGGISFMVDIKEYDFFAQNKEDFYNKFSHESILCQGRHWERLPLVTILITTYKRPELLSKAIASALNQKGFDDYQIIIVDNEGRPINEETPTARVVKKFQNEKIIYYRHLQEVAFKSDSAVRLARSPWIVFLHDDDLLEENHLRIMTDVVRKHKEINFLGCPAKEFNREQDIEEERGENIHSSDYEIRQFLRNANCLGSWAGWQGALINRECYIAIGGMPSLEMGCGDKAMTHIFNHHYGMYGIIGKGLYYCRIGEQQTSSVNKDAWEKIFINEYFFYRYVIHKYHKLLHKVWERNIAYYILQRCEAYNHGVYHTQIDINHVIDECNMPSDIKKKGFLFYTIQNGFMLYRILVKRIGFFYMQILGKSDMHLTV